MVMDAYFWLDGHGRLFLEGRSSLERRLWTLIFLGNHGRLFTVMEAHGLSF